MKKRRAQKIPKEVQEKLAKEFHRSIRTVRDWISCGLPCSQKGYDSARVQEWLRVRKQGVAEDISEGERKYIVEFRKWKAQRMKLEVRRESGLLIPRKDHDEILRGVFELFAHFLKKLPQRIAGGINRLRGDENLAIDVELITRELTREAQGELYDRLRGAKDGELINAQSGQEVGETATETAEVGVSAPDQNPPG